MKLFETLLSVFINLRTTYFIVSTYFSSGDTQISATVNGDSTAAVDSAVELVRSAFSTTESVFSYNGVSYSNADASCVVSADGSCTSLVSATTSSTVSNKAFFVFFSSTFI